MEDKIDIQVFFYILNVIVNLIWKEQYTISILLAKKLIRLATTNKTCKWCFRLQNFQLNIFDLNIIS